MIPHCLDDRLTDGGKVVSVQCRLLLYSQETLLFCSWYSLLLETGQSCSHVNCDRQSEGERIDNERTDNSIYYIVHTT
jgi:hypothetical protein